jgi:hypothetical protein
MIIFAYIDPGSGLLAWQAIMAAILGLLFYLKRTRDFLMKIAQKLFKI